MNPSYKDKAIPMISVDPNTGKYVLQEEAMNFIRSIPGPIGVISVAGMYRTGKSYLLNRMLLNRSNGFGVGPTVNPCTKGLWCWATPIKGLSSQGGEPINIIVIDTQGIGALDQDQTHDTRIFTLAILASSCFIYNSVGSIDQNAVQNLSLVVNLTKHIHLRTQNQKNQEQQNDADQFANFFPSFYWVVRDFSLQLVDSEGQQISPKQYLQRALAPQKGISDDVQQKNRIRRLLTTFFKERECFTLIRPLVKQQNLQNLDKLDFQNLRPEFVDQVMVFRKKIIGRMKPKVINDKKLNGQMYLSLLGNYVNAINDGAVPNIENAWNYMCKQQCTKIQMQALQLFQMKFKQQFHNHSPKSEQQFNNIIKNTKKIAYDFFKIKAFGDNIQQYRFALKNGIKQKIKNYRTDYERESNKILHSFFMKYFAPIEKKLKLHEFKIFNDFDSELNAFFKAYMENTPNLPNKKLIFLDIIRKIIPQGANYFIASYASELEKYKNAISQKDKNYDKELKNLKEELNKERKTASQKIQNLDRQIVDLTLKNQRLTQQLQRINKIKEQQSGKLGKNLETKTLEYENLKKTMQQRISQMTSKNEQLNLNLNNNLHQYQKDKAVYEAKINQLNNQLVELNRNLKSYQNNSISQKSTLNLQLKQATSKYEKIIDNNKKEIRDLKQRNSELIQEIKIVKDEMKKQNEQSQKLNKKLKDDLSNKSKELDQMKKEIDRQKNQLKSQFQNNKQKISKSQLQLTQMNLKLNQEIKALNEQFKSQKKDYQKQIAVLKQNLEFLQIQLTETKNQLIEAKNAHQLAVADLQEMNQRLSDEDLKKKLQEQRNNFNGQLKRMNQDQESKRKTIQNKLQNEIKVRNELQLTISLLTNTAAKLKQENQNIITDLKSKIVNLQAQIQSKQNNKEAVIKQKQQYYQHKIRTLQSEIEQIKQKNQSQRNQNHSKTEQTIAHLKMFYAIQNQNLQGKIISEKEKAEKKLKKIIQEIQNTHKEEKAILQTELEQLNQQYSNLQDTFQKNVKKLDQELEMKEKKIQNYERILTERTKLFSEKQLQLNSKYNQLLKTYKEQKIALETKIMEIQNMFNKKDTEYIKLYTEKQHLFQTLQKTNASYEQTLKSFQEEKNLLEKNLQDSKKRYTEISNQFMLRKSQDEKTIALNLQQIKFKNKKIEDIQRQRQNINAINQQKLRLLKQQLIEQNKRSIQKIISQHNDLNNKYQRLKLTSKETQSILKKNITDLERQRDINKQRFIQIENKFKQTEQKKSMLIQKLNIQLSKLKETSEKQCQALKDQLVNLKIVFNRVQNQKDGIQADLQKQKTLKQNGNVLYESKYKQMQSQYKQKIKKFESTIQNLYKKNSTERAQFERQQYQKYNTKQTKILQEIHLLNQNHTKRISEIQTKLRETQTELKSLKQKTSLQIQTKSGTIISQQKIINQLKQANAKNQSELQKSRSEKQSRSFQYQKQLQNQKDSMKLKLRQMQEKLKTSQNEKRNKYFEFEKEKARWRTQAEHRNDKIESLNQAIAKYTSDIEKLQRENERIKAEKKNAKHSGTNSFLNNKWGYEDKKMNKSNLGQDYSIFNTEDVLQKENKNYISRYQQ